MIKAWRDSLQENRFLLLALLVLLLLFNIPYGYLLLYPFKLFSTWIHELCHVLAAFAVGGDVTSFRVFSDGSGIALTKLPDSFWRKVIVYSAGYLGTSMFGSFLLLSSRPTSLSRRFGGVGVFALGMLLVISVQPLIGRILFLALLIGISILTFFTPQERVGRTGLLCFGALMLLSILFASGFFTLLVLAILGASLIALGLLAKPAWRDGAFAFLATTCGLNALTSIKALFATHQAVAGKTPPSSTTVAKILPLSDAALVAQQLYIPSVIWSSLWFVCSLLLLAWALYQTLFLPAPKKNRRKKTNKTPDTKKTSPS